MYLGHNTIYRSCIGDNNSVFIEEIGEFIEEIIRANGGFFARNFWGN
jgi:hypothetical protein